MNLKILRILLTAFVFAVSFAASADVTMPRFEKLEQSLDLTPEQKAQFDVAVAATQRLLFSMAISGLQMKERLKEEFSKPRPDLGALAELREAIVEQSRPLRREARDEWLKLYAMLNESQVATIKFFLEEKLDRLEALHDFMLRLILGPRKKDSPPFW